jgi:hypothetical protein
LAWYRAQEPFDIWFMYPQASVLSGVSPKLRACSAWTFGVLM